MSYLLRYYNSRSVRIARTNEPSPNDPFEAGTRRFVASFRVVIGTHRADLFCDYVSAYAFVYVYRRKIEEINRRVLPYFVAVRYRFGEQFVAAKKSHGTRKRKGWKMGDVFQFSVQEGTLKDEAAREREREWGGGGREKNESLNPPLVVVVVVVGKINDGRALNLAREIN